jgi:hypothetical protein
MGKVEAALTGAVFGVFGLGFAALALWTGLERHAFLRGAQVTSGEVVALNAGPFHPQIAFTTARGTRISYPQGGFIPPQRVGRQVQVRYRPDAPRLSPVLDHWGALWGEVVLEGLLGSVFVLVGGRRLALGLRRR